MTAITPQNFTSFGELLRYLRERVELSQKELAAQVGYHYSYMSRIEKNQRTPDPKTLLARFIPALALDDEPQWTARLLELAGGSETKPTLTTSPADGKTASLPPTTALPIFDLSASNLPFFLTALLGRDEEVSALTQLINRSDVRLVTVVGAPGVGKTRLAAHVAAQLAGTFAQGPLFVDLTVITQVDEFLPELAQTLGVVQTSDMPLIKDIIVALRQRNTLLVIDNFEQVIDAATLLPNLLMGAPNIKILVTSREALHISGEYEFPLVPLPVPESQTAAEGFETVSRFAAVQLFAQRAQAVSPSFQLNRENISAIVEICERLDGLPLAIELAAVCIKSLAPQTMIQQLNRRFEWLTRGSRDSLKQTLRGAIEWSFNLLTEQERTVLCRLSVFVDGCTLRSAETVCADAALPRETVLEIIVKLMDKSLVTSSNRNRQVRYYMLESLREFGREKLIQSGEMQHISTRHLIHFTEYAEDSEKHLDGSEQGKWIRFTENEQGNFHAALNYALIDTDGLQYGLRIGSAISLFWLERNHFKEAAEWLGTLLEKADAPQQQIARAKMLYRNGAIQTRAANYNVAYKLCEQSIKLARTLDDKRVLPTALCYLGQVCTAIRDYPKARQLLEESTALCRAANLTNNLAITLIDLGKVLLEQGETEQADAAGQEALKIAKSVDDTWVISHALLFMGSLHRFIGKRTEAIEFFEQSLPYIREIGDRLSEGTVLANLSILYNLKSDFATSGHVAEQAFVAFQAIGNEFEQPFPLRMMGYSAIQAGNMVRARALILESLKGNRGLDHLPGQLACLVAMGMCERAQGNPDKAITYAAVVENRVSAESITLLEPDAAALDQLLTAMKDQLGNKSFKQIVEKSKSLNLEELIASELPSAV